VTLADSGGVPAGAFPKQYELAEFEQLAGCTLSFAENPDIGALNARIAANPDSLPPVDQRLPEEPLVVVPEQQIGVYGGALDGLSNATEAGTSDLLSVRHVNLVRFDNDLQTIVPNVARSWEWNDDFTKLTFHLRKGHKWSDGEPFTAEDIVFWYDDLILNKDIFPETPAKWLFDGKPMKVTAVDDTTVEFDLPVATPGLLTRFAVDFAQPFQPKHFLAPMMPKYNPKADEEAKAAGYEGWVDRLTNFYGSSDWKDVPSPLLDGSDNRVAPTLEAFILSEETAEGRKLVANPYFHMVDTAGNQLPYIDEIDETYVPDKEVRVLKITNGEVDYKAQALFIDDFPVLKDNEGAGNYTVDLVPATGEAVFYAFNVTHKDPEMTKIFGDVRFREAMSLAIDRNEINEVIYLGQGEPQQAVPADPNTVSFVTDDQLHYMTDQDIAQANALLDEMGLKDVDGDGFRERLDGSKLTVLLEYSNQGAPVKLHELVKGYWEKVGVRVLLKEVSSDEYRTDAANNDLDLTVWKNDNTSGATISQNPFQLIPPFGNFFNPGTGTEWAKWKASDGAEGIEPPDDVKKLYELANQFQQVPLGSDQSNTIGHEIVDIHVKNLWKIGIVGNLKAPVVHHNDLGNFEPFTVKSFDYYWAYPYRTFQWFLSNG